MAIAVGLVSGVGAPVMFPGEAAAQASRTDQSVASRGFASVRSGAARSEALRQEVTLNLRDASLESALEEISRQVELSLVFNSALVPPDHRVTLRADRMTAAAALQRALEGSDLDLIVSANDEAVLVKRASESVVAPAPPRPAVGSIAGRVTDASTGAGLSGASVLLDGTNLSAVTGNTGRYRIADVPAGTYRIVVQQLGYAEADASVIVSDGGEATADFALDVGALPLDEIVATGTAFETRVRTMPNPISVINARQIEAKGATKLEDVIRGEIPGVMVLSGGQEDFSTFYVRGNAGGGSSADLIKIYVDGIELAHPRYLSTLDVNSIERIEVVRGPQSSAIYGSEAASGVLQIFTKKGTPGLSRPQLEFQASAGMIESAYTPTGASTPLTQDYSLQVSGGGESFSYRAGTSYATVGEWVKHYGSKTLSFSGGLRAVHGPLTAEFTALWSDRDYDFGNTPFFLRYPAGACAECGNPDYHNNSEYAMSQSTMALTLGWLATPKWRHTLTLGDDQNRRAYHQPEPSYNTPADTFVGLNNQEYRRRQVRYHTAYEGRLGESVTARWTAGLDYWSYDVQGSQGSSLLGAFGTVRGSSSSSYELFNDGWWNAGYFGMAELGFGERFYVTLATRVEDNANLGDDYGTAFVPRVGASYVHALGSAEVKFRAQWGKGVRPPPPEARTGRVFQSFNLVNLPNPSIAPEEKVGWDAGVDIYWGNRASFSLTRFDEEAKNLIALETIDATSTPVIRQYRNVGVVDLKGWEAEGEVTLGRLTLSANYAYSDAVVRKVDAATAANPNATLHVGDRTVSAPKHSGGGRVTARVGGVSVSVDASVMAGGRNIDAVAYYDYLYGGDPYRGSLRAYYVEYPALWKWNLRAERALGERWSAFLRVENLTDNQQGDISAFFVAPGRTTVVGVRWGL